MVASSDVPVSKRLNASHTQLAADAALQVVSGAAWHSIKAARVTGLIACITALLNGLACIRMIVILKRLETQPQETHDSIVRRSIAIAAAACIVGATCIVCVSQAASALNSRNGDDLDLRFGQGRLHLTPARDATTLGVAAALGTLTAICSCLAAHWWRVVPAKLLRVPPHTLVQGGVTLERSRAQRRRSSSVFLRRASDAFQDMADVAASIILPRGSFAGGFSRPAAPSVAESELPPLSLSFRSKQPIAAQCAQEEQANACSVSSQTAGAALLPDGGWHGGVAPFEL